MLNFTDKQHLAVYTREKSLLVSAAAGSGKTSVLAGRISALVREGADIRRMLVCTFTNMAAAEMRQRIAALISESAADDPRLRAQSELVAQADIFTIHKFAGKVIRENRYAAGLPADLRILAGEETTVLRTKAVEAAFDSLYDEQDADFLRLRSRYGGRTDAPLAQLVLRLYDFASSRPERIEWLKNASEHGVSSELYEKELASLRRAHAERAVMLFHTAGELSRQLGLEAQYEKDLLDERLALTFIDMPPEEYYKPKFSTMVRKLEPEWAKDRISALKKEARELIRNLSELCISSAELEGEADHMRREAAAFYKTVARFDREFSRVKLERSGMDYDDMIHFASRILADEDIAAAYREHYEYVFIDEYQDTNLVQDALLARVSRKNGRFMVGDVKQSIYRFRLADPTIFIGKTHAFDSAESESMTIHMNENFRSAPGVIEPINHIMAHVMSTQLGEIEYDENERLVPGRELPGSTELLLTTSEDNDELSAVESEAHTVAQRILELVGKPLCEGGAPLRWSDFAVLMRGSIDASGGVFSRVFTEAGIPVLTQGKRRFSTESEVFVNLLRTAESYSSDLALLSTLRSHVFSFTEPELAQIRIGTQKGTTFAACFLARTSDGDPRCSQAADTIEKWRLLCRSMRPADFLLYIKNETLYEAAVAASPGGDIKLSAFRAFFAACQEECARCESIYELLCRLEDYHREKGEYPYKKPEAGEGDNVRIMTVHMSKGLEFPVVILARTSAEFNTSDLGAPVLIHAQLGLAADFIDADARTTRLSATRRVMRRVLERELKSEELRILYVALTRAKQKLIISGRVKAAAPKMQLWQTPASWDWLLERSCMLDWIMSALMGLPCFADWRKDEPCSEGLNVAHRLISAQKAAPAAPKQDEAANKIQLPAGGFLSYRTAPLISKIGVSRLLPDFAETGGLPPVIAPATGTIVGTALGTLLHLFLQRAPLSCLTQDDILAEIDKMRDSRLVTPAEEAALRRSAGMLAGFYTSDLAYRVRTARWIRREQPFSLLVPGRELALADTDERVLVQGVIDLVFEEADGMIIVDYKSNMADESTIVTLAGHYHMQMQMYSRAVNMLSGRPVVAKYLYFLRPGLALEVM